MESLVSIVVPVYNVEDYLDKCIATIVQQTYKNLQIILVDDGSTDRSSEKCDLWATKDKRIRVIHKTNAGLGMARNTGIDNSNGEYILFFDSDDYIDKSLVEKCVKCAKTNDVQVVIYGRYNVYENGVVKKEHIEGRQGVFCGNSIKNELLPSMFVYKFGFGVSAWGKMYSLNVIKSLGIRFCSEREIISEDSYFSLEFFSSITKAAILPENLYYYRRRSNSLSRNYQKHRQEKNNIFLQKCLEFAKNNGLYDTVSSQIKARYHGITLGTLMQIVRADLSAKEKNKQLKCIYKDDVLKETLADDVIKFDGRFPKIFWRVLKMKLYFLCTILLYFNAQKR